MSIVTAVILSSHDVRALEDALRKLLKSSEKFSYRFALKPAEKVEGVKILKAEVAYHNLSTDDLTVISKVSFPTSVNAFIRMR